MGSLNSSNSSKSGQPPLLDMARLRSSAGSWRPKSSRAIRWAISRGSTSTDLEVPPKRAAPGCRYRTAEALDRRQSATATGSTRPGLPVRNSCKSSASALRSRSRSRRSDDHGDDALFGPDRSPLSAPGRTSTEQVQPPPKVHVPDAVTKSSSKPPASRNAARERAPHPALEKSSGFSR